MWTDVPLNKVLQGQNNLEEIRMFVSLSEVTA